jgi:pimeloyl-ACP methyl ester carboxylesterase
MPVETFLLALMLWSGFLTPDPGALAPGDGLGLDPAPVTVSEVRLPAPGPASGATDRPATGGARPRAVAAVGGLTVAAVALAAGARRRDEDPVIVLVHGDGGSARDFDPLLAQMGVAPHRVVEFDYRLVSDGATSTSASRHADADTAAEGLDALIRSVAAEHGTVYSIHHSKGGAVGVEMIADLDAGVRPPIPGYVGAALLDPAIGSGGLGWLQRMGGAFDRIPDNGGFDPWRCDHLGCRDIRDHLGDPSGVEVVAIRNPDAVVTNFTDLPEEMRVYDLVDDGEPSALASWWNPIAALRRIFEAHGSVLRHPAVASCLSAETSAVGACAWTGDRMRTWAPWGRGNGRTLLR